MGAGASTDFKSVEEAQAAGVSQEDIDSYLAKQEGEARMGWDCRSGVNLWPYLPYRARPSIDVQSPNPVVQENDMSKDTTENNRCRPTNLLHKGDFVKKQNDEQHLNQI